MEVLRNETQIMPSHVFCEQVVGDLLKSTHVYSFKTQNRSFCPPVLRYPYMCHAHI